MDVLVGRQPILNRQERTVAYELLFRSGTSNEFDGSDGQAATQAVVANTFLTIGSQRVLGDKQGFINFPRRCLVQDSGLLLPRQRVVIEILEDVAPDAEVLAACRRLKEAGYTLAVDDVVETTAALPFLSYADYIKLELPALSMAERRRVCAYFVGKGLRVLAEKVETREDFEAALGAGCELLQGYYFARPEIVTGRQVPVSKMTCLRLISEVQRPDLDFDGLEKIVRLDVGLTRKLLCFVNSAAYPRLHQIDAIGQAFMSLGERNTRRWVTLATLPTLTSGRPDELITTSLVRARFCELVAEKMDRGRSAPGYFLTGLLSLLDAMIGRPLEELVGEMGLEAVVSDAILGRPGGDGMRTALEMAMAFERTEIGSVRRLSVVAGIPDSTASELYVQAMEWADRLPR